MPPTSPTSTLIKKIGFIPLSYNKIVVFLNFYKKNPNSEMLAQTDRRTDGGIMDNSELEKLPAFHMVELTKLSDSFF